MPDMPGISTSRVSTSGFSALIIWRAACGSGAWPTTSISRITGQDIRQQAPDGGGIIHDQDAHRLHGALRYTVCATSGNCGSAMRSEWPI